MAQSSTPRTDGMSHEPGWSQPPPAPVAVPPFTWQHDRQLFILDGNPQGWVFAELHFDPLSCRYNEVRRATYEWLGEATGVLLARTITVGPEQRCQLEVSLARWVQHFTDGQR